MPISTMRKGPIGHKFQWRCAVLLALIALALSGCQRSGAVQEMPVVVSPVEQSELPITVDLPPWMPLGESQVESSGVAFAWHAAFLHNDNTYFVYTLTSDSESSTSEATPVDVALKTDESSTPQAGQAVPLASWNGVSTGVLVFPGCIEDAQFMQIQFDRLATDQGERSGEWALRPLVHTKDVPLYCGSSMFMPRPDSLLSTDKTITFNSRGVYLGNMEYDIQRISKGLPPAPPEVDPSLIPDDAVSLENVPTGSGLPSIDNVTPIPVPINTDYLERMTLRIVDEPSRAVQFVVITILPDGTIESQTYEGVANPVESLEPTVPPSPINP